MRANVSDMWEKHKMNLLSVFVVEHNDAFVFPFLRPRLKFSLIGRVVVIFPIFHGVHVSLPDATSGFPIQVRHVSVFD